MGNLFVKGCKALRPCPKKPRFRLKICAPNNHDGRTELEFRNRCSKPFKLRSDR